MRSRTLIDLTHALSPDTPSFDGQCCFSLAATLDYTDCDPPNLFRVQNIQTQAGAGTHIDAPAHCIPDSTTIDGLELENLVTDCVVIRHAAQSTPDFLFMPEAVHVFEAEHGTIPAHAFVLFYSGWDMHWKTPRYRNDLQFPAVHPDTATLLLQRNIAGIGIDTLSPDAGGEDFPVHRIMLGAGKYLAENVANAALLPSIGATVSILPMNIAGGTEAPVRMIAEIS